MKYMLGDTEIRELSGYQVIAEVHEVSVFFEAFEDPFGDLVFKGYIKWDGCSNWHFEGHYGLHLCGLDRLDDFHELIKSLYEWTAEIFPDNTDVLHRFT